MIRFDGVSKRFGRAWAVREASLEVQAGEFFALLGPSGSGKSTLMRMLAGFEAPDEGRVLLDGQDLAGRPPHLRPVNLMFQSYALFPHLSVAGNVAYGLKQDRLPTAEIAERVEERLALVGLGGLAGRRPAQLSGGERQRAALARALAKRPRDLLLDEPLAALDRRLREATRAELKAIQRRLGTTFLMVTHDQDEAMGLADRMAVMREGRIVQVGTPRQIYAAPADRFVAGFVGEVNLIPAGGGWRAVRPEAVRLTAAEAPVAPGDLRGTVRQAIYLGDRTAYVVALEGGAELKAAQVNAGTPAFVAGDAVAVGLPDDAPVLTA
jgi:ABC-type Fe3+/spermidine/putrescine transport system ATPase subunit